MKKLLLALALLSYASIPHLCALTANQNTSFTNSDSANGMGPLGFGSTWQYQGFDSSLGLLQSVQLDVTIQATLTVHEVNHWATPLGPVFPTMEYTPTITLNYNTGIAAIPSVLPPEAQGSLITQGPTVTLAWGHGVTHTGTVGATYSMAFSNPSDLAAFSGDGVHYIIASQQAYGNNFFGGVWGSSTTTLALIYTYSPSAGLRGATIAVPDSGSSALLLLVPIAVLAVLRRFCVS